MITHDSNDLILLRVQREGVLCECLIKREFISGVTASENYHFHSVYELHVPVTGTIRLMVEDRDLLVSPGEVCVIPPNLSHYIFADASSFRIGFRFSFARTGREYGAAGDVWEKSFAALRDAQVLPHCAVYEKYLRAAAENCAAGMPDFMTADLLFLALHEIAVALSQLPAPPIAAPRSTSDAQLAEQIEIFINQHYHQRVYLEDLAAQLHLGVRQTQRVTARLFSLSFSALLSKRRLTAAKLLLKTTTLSIEEVALRCGFEDKNYFYRKFTAAFSITPGKYRAAHMPNV